MLYVRTTLSLTKTAGHLQAGLSLKRTTNSVSQASLSHVPDGHAPALEGIGGARSSLMQALGPQRMRKGVSQSLKVRAQLAVKNRFARGADALSFLH